MEKWLDHPFIRSTRELGSLIKRKGDTMKKKMTTLSMLGLAIILGVNGIVLGDGAYPVPACQQLPAPDKGPWINGYFIVARDKSGSGNPHYNVHAILKSTESDGKMKEFMFSFSTTGLGGVKSGNLCANSACELLSQFKPVPCTQQVEKAFGLTGKPVLAEIFNLATSNCGTDREMMYGELRIRVVP
jgi:hypothetical protein